LNFRGVLKKRFFGDRKITSLRTQKAIFRLPKKSHCRGDLKKRFFGDRINSYFLGTGKSRKTPKKIEFSCRPENTIFRRPKNRLFVATWKNDFSGNEKFAFSFRTQKAFFRQPKKSTFVCDI